MPLALEVTGVDLFCGVGGLTHGLQQSGVNVVAGLDIDESCRFPYEQNNKAEFVATDLSAVDASEVGRFLPQSGLRLLAGCAPCQPFSTYSRGARGRAGDDWRLLMSFGRLVEELRPELVTMENVPQLARHSVFRRFLQALHPYSVWWDVIDCAQYGVPQSRKRLVLIASRLGTEHLKLEPTHPAAISVRDVIGNMPIIAAGEIHASDPLHTAPRLSSTNMRRIRASRAGGTWRDWPLELRAPCHRKTSGSTYPSVYGRMSWETPAPTITTQCFGYGNGRFGHPEQDRAISLREAAMLQTFPPGYAFAKPDERIRFNRMGRLIGNAVPVGLARGIGEALVGHVAACSSG